MTVDEALHEADEIRRRMASPNYRARRSEEIAVFLAAEVQRVYAENYERPRESRSLGGYRDPEMDR